LEYRIRFWSFLAEGIVKLIKNHLPILVAVVLVQVLRARVLEKISHDYKLVSRVSCSLLIEI
jgi:hypothetical protein